MYVAAITAAIGRNMGNLVVLDRHLWLTLTELKDSEKTALLDIPVNPSGLFRALWRPSRSTSLKRRSSRRPLATSCPSAPAQNLLCVPAPQRSAREDCTHLLLLSCSPDAVSRRRKTAPRAEDESLKKYARSAVCSAQSWTAEC